MAGCAALLCQLALHSQVQDTTRLKLGEVLVSGHGASAIQESTVPTQVIGKVSIERLGIQSMADAVRRFAGVVVKDYGGIGGLKTVSVRGFGAEHTAVSLDGVTISDAQSGQIDIGRFSLDNVSAISLEIGQSDDIFQPARNFASAAVLSITTRPPFFEDKSYKGSIQLKGGSFGQFNPSFLWAKKIKKDLSFTLNGDWQRSDGNYPFWFVNGAYKERRKRLNSDVNIYRVEANVFKQLGDKGNMTFKSSYSDSRRGLPGTAITVNTYAAERLFTRNFFSQLSETYHFSDKLAWRASLKFTHNYDRYTDTDLKYADTTVVNRYTQDEYYATTTLLYKPNRFWDLSLAQDYVHNYINMIFSYTETVDENYPAQNKAYRNTSISAFNARYHSDKLVIQGSILGAYYGERVEIGTKPNDKKRLSPSIGSTYDLNDKWILRASYKDIYRVPTFNDMYYTQIGNRSLKPEIAKQLNVGTVFKTSMDGGSDDLSVSVDGYFNKVKDKIVAVPSMFVWSMQNVDRVRILGADVKVDYDKSLNDKLKLFFSCAYSYQNAVNEDSKEQIIYTPEHSGNVSVSFENPWVNISYSVIACGSEWTSEYHTDLNKIDAYADQSVSLNKSLVFKKHSLRFQFDLLNLSNKNYEIIKSYPMPGRSFMASANWKF